MTMDNQYLDLIVNRYFEQDLDTIVVDDLDTQITLKELSSKVDHAAEKIEQNALTSSDFILLKGNNSVHMLAWILASLKQHVPFCVERISTTQADSAASQLSEFGGLLIVDLEYYKEKCTFISRSEQACALSEHQWAYVVKTSGSTGLPKIIPISRSNLTEMLLAANERFHFTPGETWLWEHHPSFDLALWEIFGCLNFIGSFIVSPVPISGWSLDEYKHIASCFPQNITLTPSELKRIAQLDDKTTELFFLRSKSILFCGERLGSDSLSQLPSSLLTRAINIYNAYGPSEATIFCSVHTVSPDEFEMSSIPLGKPLKNTSFRVSDDDGELYITGPQLFAGYLGSEETGFDYPTGDLVEYTKSGELVFRSRASGYLKINGERLDPMPTIKALLSLPEVLDSYIWVNLKPPADQVIAAIKTDNPNSMDRRQLRSIVREANVRVRPIRYIFFSSNDWPITNRGKLHHIHLIASLQKESSQ